MPSGQLTRSESDRVIAGVAGGMADYLGIDPTLIRVAWAVAILMGWGILAYLILWIVVPPGRGSIPAVRIAEERFARGEITAEELDELRRNLGGSG